MLFGVIDIGTIVGIVVALLLIGLVAGLLWWLIGYIEAQGLGPPILFKVIRIVFVVLIVLMLIGMLLQFAGHPVVRF